MAPLSRTRGLCIASLVLATPTLLSCDSLVEQGFRGEPIATVRAVIANEGTTSPKHPRAAAFWSPDLDGSDFSKLKEQISTSQPVRDGEIYTLNLFEVPEVRLPWDEANEEGPTFSIGRILIYDDENENARHDEAEPFVGGLSAYALVHALEDLPKKPSLSRLAIRAGLHLVWLPLPCVGDPPANDAHCDVPLGAPCQGPNATDCGSGTCVDRYNFPWPEGACLLALGACVPERGVVLPGGPGGPYFALSCESDDDCGREAPYRCDPMQGACVPFNVPRVAIGTSTAFPFCPAMPMMTMPR